MYCVQDHKTMKPGNVELIYEIFIGVQEHENNQIIKHENLQHGNFQMIVRYSVILMDYLVIFKYCR